MTLKEMESWLEAVRQVADQHLGQSEADDLEVTVLVEGENRYPTNGLSIDLQFGDELSADICVY
jgi:hypothetical protein